MRGLSLVGEHYLTKSVPFSSWLCLRCRETLGVTMSVTHTRRISLAVPICFVAFSMTGLSLTAAHWQSENVPACHSGDPLRMSSWRSPLVILSEAKNLVAH